MMTNIEYANSLRLLADFYEAHPEMPVLNLKKIYLFCDTREEFLLAVKTLAHDGRVTKIVDKETDTWAKFKAEREFGGITFQADIDRKKICRLVSPAVYDCPDSLLAEESAEFQEAE